MNEFVAMKLFKTNPAAILPSYGTDFAACFDLSACLTKGTVVKGYDQNNEKFETVIENDGDSFTVKPGQRVLIPTGLIFALPRYLSMRVHPRSGISVKNGVTLCNAEGVIDPDYVDETFITLYNTSTVDFVVSHGDRVAQAELVETTNRMSIITLLVDPPKKVGNRKGGVGSTGIKG